MPLSIQNLIASYDNLPNNTEDQYTATEVNLPNNSLDHDFQVGEDNNLVITGFQDNAGDDYNLVSFIDTIKIRRNDNNNVSGDRQILWFEQQERTPSEVHLKPSLITTMEEALLGNVINRGTDNIFTNTGNKDGNDNNVERIDFIANSGLSVSQDFVSDIGFLLLERNGNDPVKVAAITEIDAEGNPSEFGTLVSLNANDWGQSSNFVVNAEVMRQDPGEEHLRSTADRSNDPQPISSVFLSYSDLGMIGDQVFYGFALFPADVNSEDYDLLDWESFSKNTPESLGGLDLVSVGSIFARENVVVPPTIISEDAAETANITIEENNLDVTDVESTDDNDSEGNGLTYNITGGDDSSLFTIDPNTGLVTFIASPDFENPTDVNSDGIYQVEVTVSDSQGLSDVQTLNITVTDTDENTPPIIDSNDSVETAEISIAENNPVVIDFETRDDNDSEGNGLTYNITGGEDGNRLTIDPNTGELTFIESPDFENPTDVNSDGIYQVEVTVSDSQGLTDVQTLNITVSDTDENTPPQANPDNTTTSENSPVTIDVLSNDSDPDGDSLNITTITSPNDGTAEITDEGQIRFQPDSDFVGISSFDYTLTDGITTSTATVNINVTAVNQPPVAEDTTIAVEPNTTISFLDLSNSDPDGEVVNLSITNLPDQNDGQLLLDGEPVEAGQIIPVEDIPQLQFEATDNFDQGRFTYNLTDNEGAISVTPATVSLVRLEIPPEPNQTPTASRQDVTTAFNTPVTFDLTSSVTDTDGTVDFTTLDLDPNLAGIQTTVILGNQGDFTVDDQGNITFTPVEGFDGVVTLPYTIQDNIGATSNPAEISITVNPELTQPEIPQTPETPEIPDNSGQDEIPQTPETPETPDNSSQDDEPEIPQTPEIPDNSSQDDEPEIPQTPETPEIPDNSGQDEIPEIPNNSGQDEIPEIPETPETPETPDNSGQDEIPEIPNNSGQDEIPQTPETPEIPDNSGQDEIPQTPETPADDEPDKMIDIPRNDDPEEHSEDCCCPSLPEFVATLLPSRPTIASVPPNSSAASILGSENPDNVVSEAQNEVILAFGGDDVLNSLEGEDWIEGGLGDDQTRGDLGNDTLKGNSGNDTLLGGRDDLSSIRDLEGQDWVSGGEGDDFLSGNEHNDILMGDEGDDVVYGGKNNDKIYGDRGNDTLHGDRGNDTIVGTNGDENPVGDVGEQDVLFGYREQDLIQGGPGQDKIYSGKDDDFSYGGKDNDWMWGDLGHDTLYGDHGDDTVFGDTNDPNQTLAEGQDVILGGVGDDFLDGNRNNDTLIGGEGNDTVRGGKDDDLLFGDVGDDQLFGDLGNDTLCGNEGDDTLYGDTENEQAEGGQDKLCGGGGNDVLLGNQEQDTLIGGDGNDTLYGGKDNDLLKGQAGDDWLWGDSGNDTLTGGEGRDYFVLFPNTGEDTVTDFTVGEDVIVLAEGITFAELEITQQEGFTVVSLSNQLDQPFAILNDIVASDLTENSFITSGI